MKMADLEKVHEFLDTESPVDSSVDIELATASTKREQEYSKAETTTTTTSSPPREKEVDSPSQIEGESGLPSMPCLMNELRRDSPDSQNASTVSDKPSHRRVESDMSNVCIVSPSSSGHHADLDSGEEGILSHDGGMEDEGNMDADSGSEQASGEQTSTGGTGGKKSRRSRSNNEMPVDVMPAKRNRCLLATKVPRSQKHKERMRLLRQKREAEARKKYNPLQDSSTSDSELTCHASTSSSDDDANDTSGDCKTIGADIPGAVGGDVVSLVVQQHPDDPYFVLQWMTGVKLLSADLYAWVYAGFRRASERSRVGAQIHGLLDSGTWDRNSIGSVLEEAMTRFAVMQRQTEERFRLWMEKLTRLDSDDDDSSKRSSDSLEGRHRQPQGLCPSPPSSFLPSSESSDTMAAYALARENASLATAPMNNDNNIAPEMVTQNGNLGVPDPDGPPVVGHYDISDTDSNQESMSVERVHGTVIKHELKTHRGQDMAAHSGCIRALSLLSGQAEDEPSHGKASKPVLLINLISSSSEGETPESGINKRCSLGGLLEKPSPRGYSPISNPGSSPEVVDLTIDTEEDNHLNKKNPV